MAARTRNNARLQHHALQSLLAVRPLERLYAGQARQGEGGAVLVRQLLPGLPDTERAETTVVFEQHFARLATLTLPGCLPLRERLDAGHGPFYLVTDAPHGGTVGELVRQFGALPVATAARIVVDVVDLLLHARAAGVCHAGLHRGSVLIAPSGAVTLLDLGVIPFFLQRLAGRLQRVHAAWDSLFPDPSALAPEIIAGDAFGEHTDIYGVGALLYLLLTATLPYGGSSMVAYNSILAGRTSTDPRDVVPSLDSTLAQLVVACLQRLPEDRPASLEAVRAGLVAFAIPADAAFQPIRLSLTDRPWLDRFQPLLRLVDKEGGVDLSTTDENGVVVPLFQASGKPLTDVELLARMSQEQRRIYLAGGSVSPGHSRRQEARRGILLGMAVALIVGLIFAPRILGDFGLFGSDASPEPVPLQSVVLPAMPRAAELDPVAMPRRGLVLYPE